MRTRRTQCYCESTSKHVTFAEFLIVQLYYYLALIERKDDRKSISEDGDFVRVSAEFLEEWRNPGDVMEKLKEYDIEAEGKIAEKIKFSDLNLNGEVDSLDTRMIVQEKSGEFGEEDFCDVLANDGYKWIANEFRTEPEYLTDTARGANRPQVIWWDETLGTEAAFWVDDDLVLCAKGKVYSS